MFEIPDSQKSLGQNQFQFSYKGEQYTIPKVKYISPRVVREMSTLTPQETIFYLLEQFGGEALLDELDDMEQVEALYRAWMEDSGIGVGESSASGSSFPNIQGPSEPTSSEPVSTPTGSARTFPGSTPAN